MSLKTTETQSDADPVTCEMPENWKFCFVSPIDLFPYQVHEIGPRLLTAVKYDERKKTLKIENIPFCLKVPRLIEFLTLTRAQNPDIRITFDTTT